MLAIAIEFLDLEHEYFTCIYIVGMAFQIYMYQLYDHDRFFTSFLKINNNSIYTVNFICSGGKCFTSTFFPYTYK